MKKNILIVILLVIFTVFASWIYIPLEDRIKASELVIIGKIDSIKYKAIDVTQDKNFPGTFIDIGYIKIHKILWNKLSYIDTSKTIPLVMSSVKDKWVSSNNISYENGRYGIWILDYRDKKKLFHSECYLNNYQKIDSLIRFLDIDKREVFSASYPDDFQRIDSLNKVLGIISNLKANINENKSKDAD